MVVDAAPKRRHRQHDPAAVTWLEKAAQGTPGEILLQSLDAAGPVALREAIARAGLSEQAAAEAVDELNASADLMMVEGDALVLSRAGWTQFLAAARSALGAYHRQHPLRVGMPREELKSRLAQASTARKSPPLAPRAFNALLAHAVEAGLIASQAALVRLPEHVVTFTTAQQARVDALLADFRRDPYNTPLPKDCAARVGEDVLAALVDLGSLVQVSPDVVFLPETYQTMLDRIKTHLRANGKITVAEVRDLFKTSRKYALALMEHLDASGVTRRVGDERVLKS
jgi:selenocysteine-specific elongation factor